MRPPHVCELGEILLVYVSSLNPKNIIYIFIDINSTVYNLYDEFI